MKEALDYLLVQSDGANRATVRIQSLPLAQGLAALSGIASGSIRLEKGVAVSLPRVRKYVVFHYHDQAGLALARAYRKQGTRIACFCSDIYTLDHYKKLDSSVDVFLVPTEAHREILAPALDARVEVLPEAVDPIALPRGETLAVQENNDLCWFGYPESFLKSFRYLLPALADPVFRKRSRFTLISDPSVVLLPGSHVVQFDEKTFYSVSSASAYCVLSHFPFDVRVNTWIKSPNKLITALVRGMIPLISNTPNYRNLAESYGLERQIFRNGSELREQLRDMNFERDRVRLDIQRIAIDLTRRFSPQSITKRFLEICS